MWPQEKEMSSVLRTEKSRAEHHRNAKKFPRIRSESFFWKTRKDRRGYRDKEIGETQKRREVYTVVHDYFGYREGISPTSRGNFG